MQRSVMRKLLLPSSKMIELMIILSLCSRLVTSFRSSICLCPKTGKCNRSVIAYGQRRGQFVGGSLEFGEAPSGGGGKKKKKGKKSKAAPPAQGKQRDVESAWTEVSGVTLPQKAGDIKAWELEFGGSLKKFACVRPRQSEIYLIDGTCSRCGFDLWKGEIILPEDGSPPRLSCNVCRQVFELPTGDAKGIQLKDGFSGWVNGLARSATTTEKMKPIKSFPIRARRGVEQDGADKEGEIIVEVDFTALEL